MKVSEGGLLAVFLIATLVSCSGGSSASAISGTAVPTDEPTAVVADDATATPITPTELPTATAEPTPSPAVAALTDEDRAAAAIAAFDADPKPSNLIAWDVLGVEVLGETVQIELCAWTGETVYDSKRTVEYRVEQGQDGAPQVQYVFDSGLIGDCLNSELIDSALAATRTYDEYWSAVLADPTSFDPAVAATITTEGHAAAGERSAAQWAADGVHLIDASVDAGLPDSSLTGVGWRRYNYEERFDVFEVAVCRDHGEDYGMYNEFDVLVDDFRTESAAGTHAIDLYALTIVDGAWVVAGVDGRTWAECLRVDWIDGLNIAFADPVPWSAL